jgi:hypothetical protein
LNCQPVIIPEHDPKIVCMPDLAVPRPIEKGYVCGTASPFPDLLIIMIIIITFTREGPAGFHQPRQIAPVRAYDFWWQPCDPVCFPAP